MQSKIFSPQTLLADRTKRKSLARPLFNLKEKFGLFVDFEFLTEMGSWGTD